MVSMNGTEFRAGTRLITLPERDFMADIPCWNTMSENENQNHMLSIKQFHLTNSIYIRYLKEEFISPV